MAAHRLKILEKRPESAHRAANSCFGPPNQQIRGYFTSVASEMSWAHTKSHPRRLGSKILLVFAGVARAAKLKEIARQTGKFVSDLSARGLKSTIWAASKL
jgi:hypothetical protein